MKLGFTPPEESWADKNVPDSRPGFIGVILRGKLAFSWDYPSTAIDSYSKTDFNPK